MSYEQREERKQEEIVGYRLVELGKVITIQNFEGIGRSDKRSDTTLEIPLGNHVSTPRDIRQGRHGSRDYRV
jgi:hypothetical protein